MYKTDPTKDILRPLAKIFVFETLRPTSDMPGSNRQMMVW